jgi:hypothetical protein
VLEIIGKLRHLILPWKVNFYNLSFDDVHFHVIIYLENFGPILLPRSFLSLRVINHHIGFGIAQSVVLVDYVKIQNLATPNNLFI